MVRKLILQALTTLVNSILTEYPTVIVPSCTKLDLINNINWIGKVVYYWTHCFCCYCNISMNPFNKYNYLINSWKDDDLSENYKWCLWERERENFDYVFRDK